MKLILLLQLLFFSTAALTQSTHQQELLNHPDTGIAQTPANKLPRVSEKTTCDLNKMVFGWHPYWVNGLEANYEWNLISDLCYFSYEVNSANGNATSTHGFATNDAIDTALVYGVKVHLCVTLFSGHATFFANSTAQTTLINNLIALLQARGAHGINIDFEGVPASQSANLTTFMTNLGTALHTADPNYKLSICLYAVDWSNVFNELVLNNSVDFYTIMGYDYYYSGSTNTGPNDPLYGFTDGYDYSLSRSVSYYLNEGIPTSKLVLGLPYYGKEWETNSNAIPSSTTGNNNFSRTYAVVKNNVSGNYINANQITRPDSKAYVFQNGGTWRQCWISEENELKNRYDLVNRRNLKGIGIWTLGYDDGYNELWDAIETKLTTCNQWACSDTLYDEGGAEGNYYNNELVEYTISPPGATSIVIDFLEFATEANFDTLWLYDGSSVNSPLIGFYHGTTGPGQFTTTSGQLTLKFKSDGSTRASGWKLAYTCIQDNEAPTIAITIPSPWVTDNFTATYLDQDNIAVTESYWNAQSLQTSEWKSNALTGHVYDGFSTLGDWNTLAGIWELNNGQIIQTDESNSNTNVYLSSPLNGAEAYLYHWKGSIDGAGVNRRAGMHFMCDDLTLPNRGNSYFVWFRVDSDVIQLYEVTNDVFSLTASYPYAIDPTTIYDCKLTYSLVNGKMDLFVNDFFIGSWTDTTPLTVSNGISLRSGNAVFNVDEVAVYCLRTTSTSASVGATGHFYSCNPSPLVEAGKIASLAIDAAKNLGSTETLINVDYTIPTVAIPQEELTDFDTLINSNQLTLANLIAIDTNSGIASFTAIVEDLNGISVLPETPISSTSFLATLNGLVNGTDYRIKIMATNGAGLNSDSTYSDGFIYLYTIGIDALSDSDYALHFFPNPSNSILNIELYETGTIAIYNSLGEKVVEYAAQKGIEAVDVSEWSDGIYYILFKNQIGRFIKD